MEVNETRNGLVSDILLNIRKSAENGKTQLFNLNFQKKKKKVEYPFKSCLKRRHMI